MSEEEKKVEEKKVEEIKASPEVEKQLARIELGKDYTAEIFIELEDKENKKKIEFIFKVHVPTMKEELKIPLREEEILGKVSTNIFTNAAVRMIATLDVVTDEIKINGEKYNKTFWEIIQGIRQVGKFYKDVIYPAYSKFVEFQNSAEMDFDDLKNGLAQINGKK